MNWSNQKLALAGCAIAIGCATLGRYSLPSPVRERDVVMIFASGFIAGLSVVRFFTMWRRGPEGTATTAPGIAAPPKTKS